MSVLSIATRFASIADLEAAMKISSATFYETFERFNSPDNMKKYLAEKFSSDQMRTELLDSNNEFLLAYAGDQLIGYAKLRKGKHPAQLAEENAIEMERLYVLKAFHRKKVGETLMQHCLDHAAAKGFKLIWLGVWEKNPGSIAFYEHEGFTPFGTHVFQLGDDPQTDILMKKEL